MKQQKKTIKNLFPKIQMIEDITPEFLTNILWLNFGDDGKIIKNFSIVPLKPGLISDINGKILRIYLDSPQIRPKTLILKTSPSDTIVHKELIMTAKLQQNDTLIPLIPNLKFNIREALTYKKLNKKYGDFMPYLYYLHINKSDNRIWLFIEDVKDFVLYDKWGVTDSWTDYYVDLVLRDMASFHLKSWNENSWHKKGWLLNSNPPKWRKFVLESFLVDLSTHSSLFNQERKKILFGAIENLDLIWKELALQPHTLIHGDCTPRNICFRPLSSGLQLTLYDWALTAYQPPQLDLAKFLLFVYDPYTELKKIHSLVNKYISYLPLTVQSRINRDHFYYGFEMACLHYALVYLTVIPRYKETQELNWLFKELEYRLRFIEQKSQLNLKKQN